jgi:hypothetical protein
MEELEYRKVMEQFNFDWMNKAQELRYEAEQEKCDIESALMTDITALHEADAGRIIGACMSRFQQCVQTLQDTGDPKYLKVTYPPTTLAPAPGEDPVTTTPDPWVPTTEPIVLSDCEKLAQAAAPAVMQTVYTTCLLENQALAEEIEQRKAEFAGITTTPAPPDCSMCDSYCRSFDWVHLNPEYAAGMNYTGQCGPKICPWFPECGYGPNLHEHCSDIGCKCPKAECRSTTTTTTRYRRALSAHLAQQVMSEDNETCTCRPGMVDMVIVGRPFKVFYADSGRSDTGGRRLDAKGRPINKRGRVLSDIYNDPARVSAELGQGLYVEMQGWIDYGDHQEFKCSEYFSDPYRYVYPRTVGPVDSYEALVARLEHPDLGCGYKGSFKVTCDVDPDDATNCSYKVDISTCVPPNYQEAIDSCYKEVTWDMSSSSMYIPELPNWLTTEKLPIDSEAGLAGPVPNFSIVDLGNSDPDQCCEAHVGSECVLGKDYHGTDKGTWVPEQAMSRASGYFPLKFCSDQAKPFARPCPMVAIKELPSLLHESFPECDEVCNLTMAQMDLMSTCSSSVENGTKALEEGALRSKVGVMTRKRADLEFWARRNWPMVQSTTDIVDCVDDSVLAQRYNTIGFGEPTNGFEKLKVRYTCRINQCTANQCLKITRQCPIPEMSTSPELQCGPFGDQNMYSCVDKLPIQTQNNGPASHFTGWVLAPFTAIVFLASFWSCFQACCLKKNARVVPSHILDKYEKKGPTACHICHKELDTSPSLWDSLPICEACLEEKKPDTCRNCGAMFDDDDDNFCIQCAAPRSMLALPTTLEGDQMMCKLCGEPLGENDGKCPECGWHVDLGEDAIVLRADNAPLRANAQSASNEHRIVPVGAQHPTERPIVGIE